MLWLFLCTMKKIIILLFALSCGINSVDAQKFVRSGIQANLGISSATARWDKDFSVFNTFFTDIASLSTQPGLRLYAKPQFNYNLNYIRNLNKNFTWKGGLMLNSTQIERTDGDSYNDTTSIKLQEIGAQFSFVKVFHPAQGNEILIQIGASASKLSLKDNQLISKTDTTDVLGFFTITQESNLFMEVVSPLVVQGIARVEWLSSLNENWSVSASIEARIPFTLNTRFVGETVINNPLFPITTASNTPNFTMPYWSCSLGIVRILEWKKKAISNPLGAL